MTETQTHTNIELKVRCDDLDAVRRRALAIGATDRGLLRQRDTFFRATGARLKLRELDGQGELIAYQRPDTATAKTSRYLVFRTECPEELRSTLELALGSCGVVIKTRHLLLHRQTRIHLDTVEGLGTFAELETVVTDQNDDAARMELQELAVALGLDRLVPVPGAYVDLVASGPPCG